MKSLNGSPAPATFYLFSFPSSYNNSPTGTPGTATIPPLSSKQVHRSCHCWKSGYSRQHRSVPCKLGGVFREKCVRVVFVPSILASIYTAGLDVSAGATQEEESRGTFSCHTLPPAVLAFDA